MHKHYGDFRHRKDSGFTIVEIMIVVIIIGILSSISGVAYTYVRTQNSTKTSQANASALQRKMEAYATITNSYPTGTTASTFTSQLNSYTDSSISSLDLQIGQISATSSPSVIAVDQCTSAPGTSFKIRYWDSSANTQAATVYTGAITSAALSCPGYSPVL